MASMLFPVRFRPVSGAQQLLASRAGRQMEFRILGPLEVWDGERRGFPGRAEAARAPRRAPPPRQRGRSHRPADRRALGRGLARGRRRRTAGQRLATSQGASAGRADDQIARLRRPGRARRARSPPLRAAGGRGEELARSRPCGRRARSGSATRCRCGGARRSRTSPTRASPRRRSPGSRRSASQRSSSGSTPTSRLGRHDELVGELEALVAEHPLRERLRRCLMTALYRSGRQAEALEAYQDARRALVDELGIEPSTALQELERAILRQDPCARRSKRRRPSGVREVAGAVDSRRDHARDAHVDALLAVAEPLVRHPPRVLILARLVSDAAELRSASAWLEERRSALEARGVVARAASFTSTAPGEELARLATELDVELLLAEAPDDAAGRGSSRRAAHCPARARRPATWRCSFPGTRRPTGPVLVPFGGAEHDWAAVELGAWFARADRSAAPARRRRRRAGAGQARREPPALARRARGPAGPGHLGRAAADAAGRGGHAGGEPRRRPARRRAVDEVAPRGSRPGPPQTRQRGRPAHAARAAGSTPRAASLRRPR